MLKDDIQLHYQDRHLIFYLVHRKKINILIIIILNLIN